MVTSITNTNQQQQDDNNSTIATADLCRIIHTNMQELEKSLRCPICLRCCRNATYISGCFHVYCHDCIQTTLRRHTNNTNTANTNTSTTPCPTCNQPFTRRSLVSADSAQFDDLVLHYKKATQAFGLAPLEPNRTLQMTQLLPPSPASQESATTSASTIMSKNDNDNNDKKDDNWMETVQHYQVAQTMFQSLAQGGQSSTFTSNGDDDNHDGQKNNNPHATIVAELKAVVSVNHRSMMRAIERHNAKIINIKKRKQQMASLSQLQREALDQQAADANLLDDSDNDENEDDDIDDDLDRKPAAADAMAFDSSGDCSDDVFYTAEEEQEQQQSVSNKPRASSSILLDKNEKSSSLPLLVQQQPLPLASSPKMMPFVTTTRGGGSCRNQQPAMLASRFLQNDDSDDDDDNDDELPPLSGLSINKKKTSGGFLTIGVNNSTSSTGGSSSNNKANVPPASAASRLQKSSPLVQQQQLDNDDNNNDVLQQPNRRDDIVVNERAAAVSIMIEAAAMDRAQYQEGQSTIVVTTTSNNNNNKMAKKAPPPPTRAAKRQKVVAQKKAPLAAAAAARRGRPPRQAAAAANLTIVSATTTPTASAAMAASTNSSNIVVSTKTAAPGQETQEQERTTNIVSLPRNPSAATRVPQADREGQEESDEESVRTDAPVVAAGNGNMLASPADRVVASVAAAPSGDNDQTRATTTTTSAAPTAFPVGAVVTVQSRTWPGYNKQGGVGRITKVHQGGGSILYDIKYILGGREKEVDNAFVSLQADNLGTTIKEEEQGGDEPVGGGGGERRSSHPRERKTSHRLEQQRADELPPALLAKLKAEGFDTKPRVGAATKVLPVHAKENTKPMKQTGRPKQEDGDTKQPSRRKRGKDENNENDDEEKPPKRRRIAQAIISTVAGLVPKAQRRVQPAPQQVTLPDLTPKELCINADKLYASRFASAMKHSTIHVVASMLSETEVDALNKLCKSFKKGPVKIKVSDSFNPTKTTLCITPAKTNASQQDKTSNLVSRHRTVKCMRAALAGVPIVSPLWIQACQESQKVVPPTTEMFIRTFPSKVGDQAGFGVALLAAAAQCNGHLYHPLQDHSVYLCGSFSKNIKADVGLLLREAGATILTHPASAVAKIKSLSESGGGGNKVVLLCADGSSSNAGITPALERQVMDQPDNILVVNVHWLFATVSSGRSASRSEAFRPQSSKAVALWEATL